MANISESDETNNTATGKSSVHRVGASTAFSGARTATTSPAVTPAARPRPALGGDLTARADPGTRPGGEPVSLPDAPAGGDNGIGDGGSHGGGQGNGRAVLVMVLAALVVIGVVVGGWFAFRPAPTPDQTTITVPSASATVSASASPSPSPSTPTRQQVAYAAAAAVYRAWSANYAAAAVNFDASKLDAKLVTPAVLARVTDQLNGLNEAITTNTTLRYSQVFRGITGVSWTPIKVQLRVCAVTNDRFITDGKDATYGSDKKPVAVSTKAMANVITMVSTDKQTWRVSNLVTELTPDAGVACMG